MRALAVAISSAVAATAAVGPPVSVDVGAHPCGIAAAYGSIWVASDGAGTLTRIDPRTNRRRKIHVGRHACWLATGANAIWIARYGSASVVRVDRRTLRRTTVDVGANAEDVAVAGGSVWVSSFDEGALVKIDPGSRRVVETLRVGGYPAGLGVAAGSLWVGFGRGATSVARVDPSTGRVTRVPIGRPTPDQISTDGRSVWVSSVDTVSRVDPATNRVVARLRLGSTLGRGTRAPDGALWLPNKEQNTLTRIDVRTNRVRSVLAAGPGSIAAAYGFGSVWVTSYAGSDVRRFRVRR